jgi:hypothetical protein
MFTWPPFTSITRTPDIYGHDTAAGRQESVSGTGLTPKLATDVQIRRSHWGVEATTTDERGSLTDAAAFGLGSLLDPLQHAFLAHRPWVSRCLRGANDRFPPAKVTEAVAPHVHSSTVDVPLRDAPGTTRIELRGGHMFTPATVTNSPNRDLQQWHMGIVWL